MQLLNFPVDKETCSFGRFVLTLSKEAQQGKLILSFDLLGLEIVFSLENEMTVFANQNTLYAFIFVFLIFCF